MHKLIASSPSTLDQSDRVVIQSYDWMLEDQSGNRIDFNTLKGKKIVVNFWATWCPPCIAEMPSFQKLYDDYKSDVVFLFVTQDDFATVSNFMQQRNFNLPVYREASQRITEFEGNSLPTTYVIDEKGEIQMRKVGAADWNAESVRKLLNN